MITCLHLHVSFPRAFRCFATANALKTWRVSSLGRVCSLNGIVSYGSRHPSGYRYKYLLGQSWPVHRVVMITFNGLPESLDAWQVHHVDGNRGNNCLKNLEYVTPSQNSKYSHATLERKCSGPARSRPVMFQRVGSTEWKTAPSITAAARELGVSHNCVSHACRTQSPARGYLFRFGGMDEEAEEANNLREEWRPMIDPATGSLVEGRLISSLGRVISRFGVIGRGYLNRMGYHETSIRVDGLTRVVHVHRLVAAAFVGLPQSGGRVHVNHKDLNKSNNAANNLEYLTPAENRAHFLTSVPYVKRTGLKPVWSRAYGSDEPWTWHTSSASAAKELGLNHGSISQCANGRTRRAGNYEFQYADMPESHPLPGEEWRDVDIDALRRDRWSRLWEDLPFLIHALCWCLPGIPSLDHLFENVSEGHSFG